MSTTEQPPSTATTIARGSVREFFTRLFRERKLGAASLLVLLTFLLVGIFADYLAPHGMLDHDISRRLQGPSVEFPLGTDQFGRDQLSRIIFGARISMIVGVAASALSVVVATILGLISGYLGGRFDLIMQRFVDAVQSFPWLFLVLTIMSILGPGILQVIIVLGVPWGIVNIRTVRSVVLSIKETAYVEAARAIGARTGRILWQHIAPQIVAPIIVLFTVSLGGNIIGEATVSFLGFGIPPPTPSWGGMLSLEGRKYMLQAPGLAFWPGLCLAAVVYAVNMFGDAMRDLLDPRLRGGIGRFGMAKNKRRVGSATGG